MQLVKVTIFMKFALLAEPFSDGLFKTSSSSTNIFLQIYPPNDHLLTWN